MHEFNDQVRQFLVTYRDVLAPLAFGLLLVAGIVLSRRHLPFVFKQMRQRALSTWLTLLSVLLGVALAIGVLIFLREGRAFFSQSDFGSDLVVGPKGSPLQLVLNTVYHLDQSQGTIPYSLYDSLAYPDHPNVRAALPFAVGDQYDGHRVVATLPHLLPADHEGHPFDLRDPALIARAVVGTYPYGTDVEVLAPMRRARGMTYVNVFNGLRGFGFREVRVQGQPFDLGLASLPTIRRGPDAGGAPANPVPLLDEAQLYEVTAVVGAMRLRDPAAAQEELAKLVSLAQDLSRKLGGNPNPSVIVRLRPRTNHWVTRTFPTLPFEYRKDKTFKLAQGRPFHPRKFEAVVGWDLHATGKLKLGSTFKAAHGAGDKSSAADVHDEQWTVVGVLERTATANDRVIFIPLDSFYAIPEHETTLEQMMRKELQRQAVQGPIATTLPTSPASRPATGPAPASAPTPAAAGGHEGHEGHEHAYRLNRDGTIDLELEKEKWKLSAVAVRSNSAYHQLTLAYDLRNSPVAMAVNPASVMREFFDTFLAGFTSLLLIVSVLVSVVAAVGILVSIYNSVTGRRKEIAILRALGATRATILLTICLEAGLVGIIGSVGGLAVGHALGFGVSQYMESRYGQSLNWLATYWWEWIYLAGVTLLAVLAGLVPALKAYKTPVATNLVGS